MFDYSGQSPYTKQIIQQLAAQGSRPVRNVGEGLASAGNSIMAAILAKKDMAEGKRRDEATFGALQNAIGADPSLANDPLIQGILSNPDVGRQLAPEILGRVLQNRLTPEKQNLPTSFREYQLAQEDPNFGQYLTDSQSRRGTRINNNVSTGGGPEVGTIPQGFMLTTVRDDAGNTIGYQMEPVPGGPADIELQEVADKDAARADKQQRQGGIVLEDINAVRDALNNSSLPVAGALGGALSNIPGTEAYDVRALTQTIRSNIGFDQLQQMRESSPTGGALGNVTLPEIERLESVLGNLDQSQSEEQFLRNLDRLEQVYLDIIHGPGNRPNASRPQRRKFNPKTGRIE